MKKIISLALASLLTAAMLVPASATTNKFEAANGTPVIDGVKDNAYACAGMVVNIDEATHKKADKGASGTAYACWDEKNFYVFVDVVDAKVTDKAKVTSIWANDSVEIYVNWAGKDGTIADINAAQFTYGPNYTKFAGGGKLQATLLEKCEKTFAMTDKGYAIEIAFPWTDYTPKADASFPFLVGINDDSDDDPATREIHLFTTPEDVSKAYQTADNKWDSITLTTKKYEAPKPAAKTADMGLTLAAVAVLSSGAALTFKKSK